MMRLYKNKVWRYVHIFLGIAAVLAAFYLAIIAGNMVNADGYSWIDSDIKVTRNSLRQPDQKSCVDKDLIIDGVHFEPRKYCYYDHGDWGYTYFDYNGESGYAFLVGDGNVAHYVTEGIPSSVGEPILGGAIEVFNTRSIKDSIAIAVSKRLNNYMHPSLSVKIYNNIPSRLHLDEEVHDGVSRNVYRLDVTDEDYGVRFDFFTSPILISAQSLDVSRNGRWLTFSYSIEGTDKTYVDLVDTEGSEQRFSKQLDYSGYTDLTVSDNGKHVAVAGPNGIDFFETNDECIYYWDCSFQNRRFSQLPHNQFIDLNFINNDRGLIFSDKASGENIELRLSGEGAGIEYLAMGDSYSSGEGDIGGNHYLRGTEGKDLCHISDRSYPFLLRDHYAIPPTYMESVACSGAQITFDYIGDDINYGGQKKRLTNEGLSKEQIGQRQQDALSNFTPGETKQINFVKKYKPSVITFTGGGNDIGFTRVLKECARPGSIGTCGYAKNGSYLHQMLYDAIDSQYKINKIFIDKIKEVSPQTRIVMIGYPSFIAGSESKCSLTKFEAGLLNGKERDMINDAVSRLNISFKNLAAIEKISYVDLEKSLYGGRVCEDGSYVNSVDDVGVKKVTEDDDPAVFHPNYKGHEKMKQVIVNEGVILEPKLGSVDNAWTDPTPETLTLPQYFIDRARVLFGDVMKVTTSPSVFWPNSSVSGLLHSDPIDLGTFEINDDGSLAVDIPTEDLPPGPHVLIFEGIGPDGKPVKYYQHIFIDYPDGEDSKKDGSNVTKKPDKKSTKETKLSTTTQKNDITNMNSDNNTKTSDEHDSLVGNDNSAEIPDNKKPEDYKKEAVNNIVKKVFNPTVILILSTCIIVTIVGVIYAKHRHRTNN